MIPALVERLRASIRDLASGRWDSPEGEMIAEAADEIERLRNTIKNCPPVSESEYVRRLEASNTEMLAVLNAARTMLKNRDQRPNEMKLLDAIKMVIANAEGMP